MARGPLLIYYYIYTYSLLESGQRVGPSVCSGNTQGEVCYYLLLTTYYLLSYYLQVSTLKERLAATNVHAHTLGPFQALREGKCAGKISGSLLPGTLLTTHYSQLTTYFLTTYHSLLTTHHSLLTTHYSLRTPHSSLLITHSSLLTTYYVLFTIYFQQSDLSSDPPPARPRRRTFRLKLSLYGPHGTGLRRDDQLSLLLNHNSHIPYQPHKSPPSY